VNGKSDAVSPDKKGTKAAVHYHAMLPPNGGCVTFRMRLSNLPALGGIEDPFGPAFAQTFIQRKMEADLFYDHVIPREVSEDTKNVERQALAGMMEFTARRKLCSPIKIQSNQATLQFVQRLSGLLWSKQFYHYIVRDWLHGDPTGPTPPSTRKRNKDWSDYPDAINAFYFFFQFLIFFFFDSAFLRG
jgi:hypothetical protein